MVGMVRVAASCLSLTGSVTNTLTQRNMIMMVVTVAAALALDKNVEAV